ncbi:hypothetical protein QE152_g997 [Popillia japonica]|uniref:Uncharacterized protein n=1 Tax=Popillia japonica TaxID=7064 RepID=A0AAW1N9H4_POPJA
MSSICGRCNKQMQPKDMVVVCSGICKGKYHTSCVDLSHQNYTAIKECSNIKYFCNGCLSILDFCMNMQREMNALKDLMNLNIKYFCNGCLSILDFCMNMQREMNALKDLMNLKLIEFQKVICTNSYTNLVVKSRNYAEVTEDVVVIKPKTNQESSLTKSELRKQLITGMKSVKDGGVIIKCKNKEDVEKIKKATEKKMKKLTDIEEDMTEEELKTSIINQNSCMQHDNLDVRVLVIKKMRSKFMAILEVDPVSFQEVTKKEKLCIGWSMCRVFEYVRVFRCFKCGGFDHKAEGCKTGRRCQKCAESDHVAENGSSEVLRAGRKFMRPILSMMGLELSVIYLVRTFSNILGYYHDAAFPLKKYTGAQLYKNPWMTAGIYRSSRTVKELYATTVRSKSVADFEYYKTYKRIYKEVILKAKQMYNDYKYNSATNKTKAVWDIINTCSNKAEKEAVALFDGTNTLEDSYDVADFLNNYFVNLPILCKEKLVRTNWIVNPTIGSLEKSIFIEPVTETTVYRKLDRQSHHRVVGEVNLHRTSYGNNSIQDVRDIESILLRDDSYNDLDTKTYNTPWVYL